MLNKKYYDHWNNFESEYKLIHCQPIWTNLWFIFNNYFLPSLKLELAKLVPNFNLILSIHYCNFISNFILTGNNTHFYRPICELQYNNYFLASLKLELAKLVPNFNLISSIHCCNFNSNFNINCIQYTIPIFIDQFVNYIQ
jgi:hypothetical protein